MRSRLAVPLLFLFVFKSVQLHSMNEKGLQVALLDDLENGKPKIVTLNKEQKNWLLQCKTVQHMKKDIESEDPIPLFYLKEKDFGIEKESSFLSLLAIGFNHSKKKKNKKKNKNLGAKCIVKHLRKDGSLPFASDLANKLAYLDEYLVFESDLYYLANSLNELDINTYYLKDVKNYVDKNVSVPLDINRLIGYNFWKNRADLKQKLLSLGVDPIKKITCPEWNKTLVFGKNFNTVTNNAANCIKSINIKTNRQQKVYIGDIFNPVFIHLSLRKAFSSYEYEPDTVKIYEIPGDKLLGTLNCCDGIGTIIISPDRKYAIIGTYTNKIQQYDVKTGKLLKEFNVEDFPAFLSVSSDLKYIAIRSSARTVRVYNLETETKIQTILDEELFGSISSNGKIILTGGNSLRMYDSETREIMFEKPFDNLIKEICMKINNETTLSSRCTDCQRMREHGMIKRLIYSDWRLRAVCLKSLKKDILGISFDKEIKLYDISQLVKINHLLKKKILTIRQVLLLKALLDNEIKEIPNNEHIKNDFNSLPKTIRFIMQKNEEIMKKIKWFYGGNKPD